MIIETVVTTLEPNGDPNFAAMGVVWGEETMVVRPFTNTRTYRNLVRSGEAVVNVTDDVLVFAKSALSRDAFPSFPAKVVRGVVLADACRWREVRRRPRPGVEREAVPAGRADIRVAVVGGGELRPFSGLCRAKHAVVEASIIASRIRLGPIAEALAEIDRLDGLVRKTGGDDERAAMAFIRDYVGRRAAASAEARRP